MSTQDPRDPPATPPTEAPDPPAERVSPEELRAYLAGVDVHLRIQKIVGSLGVPRQDVDDVAGSAVARILSARTLPGTMEQVPAFIGTATEFAVKDYWRHKYESGEANEVLMSDPNLAREQEPAHDREEEEQQVKVSAWLELAVRGETDRETLALLKDKAQSGRTYAEQATLAGMTEAALKKRVARFVAKYERRKRNLAVMLVLFFFAAAVAVVLWWWLQGGDRRHPPAEPAVPDVAPTVTAAPRHTAPIPANTDIAAPPRPNDLRPPSNRKL